MIAFSAKEARHLSLSSLGIGANTGLSSIQDTLGKLHIFQLDSVNSFERAHLLPAFSRIGAYDKEHSNGAQSAHAGCHVEVLKTLHTRLR